MAITIYEAFEGFRSNLEITELQEQTVSTRQTNIREVVERDFIVLDTFLTGSYRRNTMIAPLTDADIDIFIVLDADYFSRHGQQQLLEDVRACLLKTYTRTPKIRPDGHAVTITFTDFRVDVVPGFYRKGGGFIIPDTEVGEWLGTDPKKHVELWTAANKAHSDDLIPLIKMLKAWNKSRNLFKSFHLETIALAVFKNITISDFPSGVRYFFDKARQYIRVKVPDPAGYNDDVGAHVTGDAIDKIIARLAWAYERALEAERLAKGGKIKASIEQWNKIFNDYFPAYG